MTKVCTNINKRKKSVAKKNVIDPMLSAVAEFLERREWKVLVIGSPRIQQQPGDLQFNYEFVLKFTGKKLNGDS